MTSLLLLALGLFGGSPDSLAPTAAVVDFQARGVSPEETQILADRFRAELSQLDAFRLLERERMDQVLVEQGFQETGCTSTECAVQTGRILGVRRMIAGSVAHIGNTWSVSAREIDVETGEIGRSAVVDMKEPVDVVLTKGMGQLARKLVGATPKPQEAKATGLVEAMTNLAATLPRVVTPDSLGLPLPPPPDSGLLPVVAPVVEPPLVGQPFQVVLGVVAIPPARTVTGFAIDVGWGTIDHLRGFQVGILNQVDSSSRGIQAGAGNFSEKQIGIQAGVVNSARNCGCIQAGLLNIAGPLRGIQAGAVNLSGETQGLQFGLVNVWKKQGESRLFPFVGGWY
ncbi:MAG: hypothetical protein H6686_08105 [Fibrobacteria bacterium]|nr:hypothetical protein [Fibrobacteria bacterium]